MLEIYIQIVKIGVMQNKKVYQQNMASGLENCKSIVSIPIPSTLNLRLCGIGVALSAEVETG